MVLGFILFWIGILGFILNKKNIILQLIALELLLLASGIIIILSSGNYNDISGQTFGLYVITVAAAESAIGLSILVAFYRLRGTIVIKTDSKN